MATQDFAQRREQHLEDVRQAIRRFTGRCVASHESAALVHGVPTYTVPDVVHLSRASGSRRNGKTTVHVAALPPEHIAEIDGIPVTSLPRTVVDVARRVEFGAGLIVGDAALRAGVTRAELDQVLQVMWTWPGVLAAARVVRHADARAESPGESFVRSRFIELRLPVPDLQVVVGDELGHSARTDFWWRDRGVVGESDGRVKYTDEEGLWREKQRQEWLEEAGFVVIRWNWAQAHAPDAAFRRRLLAAFARADRLRATA